MVRVLDAVEARRIQEFIAGLDDRNLDEIESLFMYLALGPRADPTLDDIVSIISREVAERYFEKEDGFC